MADKVIVITGGATGIGAAAVVKFAREGYAVAVGDINEQAAAAVLSEVSDQVPGAEVAFFLCDVTKRDDIKHLVTGARERFGRINALFANAGIHRSNSLLTITDEELEQMVHTNVFGAVHVIQDVAQVMIEQGQGGSILINCSDQWFVGKKNNFGYGLTKGALGQITRSIAAELSQYQIRVNAICPGTIDTPIASAALGRYAERAHITLEQAYSEERALFPLNRIGTAEEVANMAFFIVDQATFSTGSHFACDGGLSSQ